MSSLVLAAHGLRDIRAFVVFTNDTDIRALRLLRPGFRHCFIIGRDSERWFSLDPMANYLDLAIYHELPEYYDLPAWLASRHHAVIEAPVCRHEKRAAPPALMTCVEVAKRFLGIHNAFILTPYQLYKHLREAEIVRENLFQKRTGGAEGGHQYRTV